MITDIVIRPEQLKDYIPELSFVAEFDGIIEGPFLFSRFPLSKTPQGGHIDNNDIVDT
ncbi:MAG: hypothetical protein IJZ25_01395 [Lachnospiraceae bacterium]|nr:hypothetical protein [Lachnospiraceae bacterium]